MCKSLITLVTFYGTDIPQPSTSGGATAGPSPYNAPPPSHPSPPSGGGYPPGAGSYAPPGNQYPQGGAQSWPQTPPQAAHQPPPQPPQAASVPQDTWQPPSNPSKSIITVMSQCIVTS